MVLLEPRGGDATHEDIWIERKPCSADGLSICLQEGGERPSMVGVKSATLDATLRRAELSRRESAGSRDGGYRFRRKLHRLLDGVER